jgi:hypothetical protein
MVDERARQRQRGSKARAQESKTSDEGEAVISLRSLGAAQVDPPRTTLQASSLDTEARQERQEGEGDGGRGGKRRTVALIAI